MVNFTSSTFFENLTLLTNQHLLNIIKLVEKEKERKENEEINRHNDIMNEIHLSECGDRD
jgi:hypothetical protein